MTPRRAERLVRELVEITEAMRELQAQRKAILDELPDGRTEGVSLAVYVRPAGHDYDVSITALRCYVSETVLNQCRVRRERGRTVRIVPKLQPKKRRNQEQT